jgi:hypothetical protein
LAWLNRPGTGKEGSRKGHGLRRGGEFVWGRRIYGNGWRGDEAEFIQSRVAGVAGFAKPKMKARS